MWNIHNLNRQVSCMNYSKGARNTSYSLEEISFLKGINVTVHVYYNVRMNWTLSRIQFVRRSSVFVASACINNYIFMLRWDFCVGPMIIERVISFEQRFDFLIKNSKQTCRMMIEIIRNSKPYNHRWSRCDDRLYDELNDANVHNQWWIKLYV